MVSFVHAEGMRQFLHLCDRYRTVEMKIFFGTFRPTYEIGPRCHQSFRRGGCPGGQGVPWGEQGTVPVQLIALAKDMPPITIVHESEGSVMPVAGSKRFVEALKEKLVGSLI